MSNGNASARARVNERTKEFSKKLDIAKAGGWAPYQDAGPTLLAAQPPEKPKGERQKIDPEWDKFRSNHLEPKLVMQRQWRESWWTQQYSNLSEFILPRRSIFLTQSVGGQPTANNMTRGRPINNAIVDPTGTFATRICAGGLMSGLASPSRPWFKIVPAIKGHEIDADGRLWLDTQEERLYTVMAGSNFYNAFAQECEDLVVFGTGPNIIYEDPTDLIRCYTPAVGEYYLSSGSTMRVETLSRMFVMTVAQIVEFFNLENCPQEIQELWAQKGNALEQERIIAHMIEPNFAVGESGFGKVPGNFTWRETYWVWGSANEKPLSLCGFNDQPFTCARWATQSNDAYGRSPGMDVLPDVMQLQVMTRRMAEAIEKQVRPPLIADEKLRNQPSSILPGHVTYVPGLSAGTGMRSIYEVNPDIRAMAENIAAIENRIKTGLFNDLFLMLEQGPTSKMTAYEVAQKMQEKLQVLGPVIEGLLTESLKPKLKRIFSIMKKRGMIDPPPASMKNIPLDIQFVSMLALAQKAAATGGIERLVALVGNMSAVFPEVKDNVNPDAVIQVMNDLLGNPQKVLFSPDQIQQKRQAQAQQTAAAQKMAAASHMADTANTGAQAAQVMSQTQIGGGQTALNAILGTGGGGQ